MLYPPVLCILCQQYSHSRLAICQECYKFFKLLGPACRYCASPLPDNSTSICGPCCTHKPAIDLVISAYRFEEPLRSLLHKLKYYEGLYLIPFFVDLMLSALPNNYQHSQCLIPVPMHPQRLQNRGFNQAAELAKILAKKMNIPYDIFLCKKIHNTPAQAQLDRSGRQKNLEGSFVVKKNNYQHVTIIDDLFTTGSTANELAKTLKQQGVAYVDVWCCAKSIL